MPDFGRWTGNGGDPSLNEINRDERFLDALATNQPVYATDQSEAELAFLLSDWRDEIRDTPVTTVVTVRDAEIAMHGALGEVSRKRTRTSLALVGSVAAAVLCLGGFSAAVYGAGPGDSFYGIRTMLFGEAPARDDQVALASQQLAQVQQLIDQGDWQQAQDKLVTLSTTVQGVDQVERKQELIQQWNALTYKVVEQDPAATLPPPDQPQPVLPSSPLTLLPVPVIEATTASTSTSDTPTSDTSVSDTSSSSETTQPSDVTSTTATPTTSPEPPTTTTSEPPTSTSTSSTTTTTTTSTTTTITTTTTTRQLPAAPPSSASALPPVVAPPVNVPPPASVAPPVIAEPPTSQPRLAVTPTQAPPAVTQPPPAATQAPSAPKQAEEPSQTVKPSEAPSAPREGGGVVTTTIVVPPAGRGN
jgi:Anti-sigma-D factor RsdA to sigma factor binding region